MKLMNNIKKNSLLLIAISICMGLASCVDENIDYSPNEYNPAEDPNMVCLPFNLSYDFAVSTRDGEEEGGESNGSNDDEFLKDFEDGTEKEHKIDFDQEKECFAIFFDKEQNFRYMKRIYLSDQLGEGGKNDRYTEYTVPVVCYIPVEDCEKYDAQGNVLDDNDNENIAYYRPKLLNVLVVLNGGKIYDYIHNELYFSDGTPNRTKRIEDVLKLTWNNPADYTHEPFNNDYPNSIGEIGKNKNGNFTFTSSAYWQKEGGKYNLKTAAKLDGKVYKSIKEYLESVENGDGPTATVYLERMVAKFTAPTFNPSVIGQNRVFRPDQNAMALVVYNWNENNEPVSVQKNWRIHLIGWAINGTESSSYIFKNIGNVEWGISEVEESKLKLESTAFFWNQEGAHRSYWSIDPHYTSGKDHFYPWQFRKASDRTDIISVEGGLSDKAGTKKEIPVLRYKTFNDLLEKTDWQPIRYVHENTVDPDASWFKRYYGDGIDNPNSTGTLNEEYLDGRASLLAGPHLLIGGELLIEGEGSYYTESGVNFGKIPEIFSDRLRNFYMTELDWFKMFMREINKSLKSQENMSFSYYNWDESAADTKENIKVTAFPEGTPKLYLMGEELTYEKLDEYIKNPNYEITFSQRANVRNGDGRLIPWLILKDKSNQKEYTLTIQLTEEGTEKSVVITDENGEPVKDEKGNIQYQTYDKKEIGEEMWYTLEGDYRLLDNWLEEDFYKSLFYEWFGPLDHYKYGYMYFVGDITHQPVLNNTNFYGTVRNHLYKFYVQQINSIGVPVDDPNQIIIPGNYNYNDQIIVYLDVIGWHPHYTEVNVP